MKERTRSITFRIAARSMRAAGLFLCAAAAFAACQVTDYSEEQAGTISPSDLHMPSSGYKDSDPSKFPVMTFDSTALHMGRIAEGTQIEKNYHFVNTGNSDLVITDVRASCGCTVAKNWPRMPVSPGKSGDITINFNSEGRPGIQHKTITVVANTDPATSVLTLHGEVVAPSPENK